MVEKNFHEEILIFDNSQIHYYNLLRLLLEGKATHNVNLIRYSLDYVNLLREIEMQKIESLTKYFLENFEFMRKNIQEEHSKKNKNNAGVEDVDYVGEWSNKSNTQKLGFWINNSDGKFKETQTKFKHLPFQIISFPKPFVLTATIIRFYWNKNDIR